ncbi:unnamed protein product, partial [Meganyctiphanes norvegica]
INEYLPWLKCGLRDYDRNLAEQCAQGHHAPRVLLLGDSRVRGLALQVMGNWQHLNLTLTTQKGSLPYIDYRNILQHPETIHPGLAWLGANQKARRDFGHRSDIYITTELAPELSVKYVYSSFLMEDQDLLEHDIVKPSIVQVLCDLLKTSNSRLPSVLVIGTGTWAIYGDKDIRDTLPPSPELLRHLDWFLESLTKSEIELRGILQQLREKNVSVIWMLQDNVK